MVAAFIASTALSSAIAAASEEQPLCAFVSSYHEGYAWSDGVERALRKALQGHCTLVQFDMDSKRRKSEAEIQEAAAEANEFLNVQQPDVIITSDDNAAKHLIVPYLMNTSTPVVFAGINWTLEEYGLPVENTTGIVEVAPIKPMLQEAKRATGGKAGIYLGAATLTEAKNFERMRRMSLQLGLELKSVFVGSLHSWKAAYLDAQNHDFIIIGSYSGIDDWDIDSAAEFAQAEGRILTLTNHSWMMPVAAVGFTKVAEEHGDWAGQAAVAILDGLRPDEIPVITNRKWDVWINPLLSTRSEAVLNEALQRNAGIFH